MAWAVGCLRTYGARYAARGKRWHTQSTGSGKLWASLLHVTGAFCGTGGALFYRRRPRGTAFIVKLAVACGVRPEWLDSGEEPMIRVEGYTTNDPKMT